MSNSVAGYFVGVKGGLVMSLIAFSIVFIVIMGLMLMMIAIKHMAAALERPKASGAREAGSAQSTPLSPPVASVPLQSASVSEEDNGELLAVISAAIAATCGSASRITAFRPVVRTPVASSWKFAARMSSKEGF